MTQSNKATEPVKLLDGPMDVALFNASIEAGRSAIKIGLLINGGGALSLLTLIGNIAEKQGNKEAIHFLALPLGLFALGLILCAGASGATALAQPKFQSYQDPEQVHAGIRIRFLIQIMMLFSYLIFLGGCATAYWVFSTTF